MQSDRSAQVVEIADVCAAAGMGADTMPQHQDLTP